MKALQLAPLLVVLSGLFFILPSASAECSRPEIRLNLSTAATGSTVMLSGRHFTDMCSDATVNGVRTPTIAARDSKIYFIQSGKAQEIGRVNADLKFEISATVTIPQDAVPGEASIVAETKSGRTLSVSFTVKPSGTR